LRGARLHAYIDRALDKGNAAASLPGADDTIDAFARLATARVDGRPLSRIEQVGLASLLLAGGRDTVILALCGAMWHLARHPAAQAALRAEPERLQLAVEEYLRYFSPNAGMERRATTDVAGSWGRVSAGELVVLGWGAANHDPHAFEAPGEIRVDRRPNPHLAFGSGPHTCTGIHLARLEVRVFLEALLADVSGWRIRDGASFAAVTLADDVVPSLFQRLPIEVADPG